MFFNVLAISTQTIWELDYKKISQPIKIYKGCNYTVELWGANGGIGCLNKICDKEGGKGAYIIGTLHSKKDQTMSIYTGEKGGDGIPNGNVNKGKGGWNGGADAGEDTGLLGGDDPSGGGGGRTDLRINGTIIMAAGGGSGSGCDVTGAPGGGIGEFGYINQFEEIEYIKNGGTGTINGSAGANSANCPGSGGGGGWVGGKGESYAFKPHYPAIAKGGSSGYNSTGTTFSITNVTAKGGSLVSNNPNKKGNGYAIVKLTNSDDLRCEIPRPSPPMTEERKKKKRSSLFNPSLSLSLLFDNYYGK